MTLARWAGVGAVVFLLTVDSLLVRSIAAARPEQWSPPIPFDNPQSYWWPADVNGTGTQPIAENPVACVYLPQGAAGAVGNPRLPALRPAAGVLVHAAARRTWRRRTRVLSRSSTGSVASGSRTRASGRTCTAT